MTLTDPFLPPIVGDEDPLAPTDEAPYGYTIDRATGERRPKKRAGRSGLPSKDDSADPASLEDLVAAPARKSEPDRAPGRVKEPQPRRRGRAPKPPKPEPEVPPFRAGPIAKGVNKLYLRAGKIVRAIDPEIGTAIIAITRKESDDDVTVGEAWEELAKVNPRIRAVLLRLITGGAWGQLLMAHMPILIAILMKERIRSRIPFMGLMGSMLDDDADELSYADPAPTGGMGGLFAGLTQDDLNQAMNMFGSMMPNMMPPEQSRSTGVRREPVAEDWPGEQYPEHE